MRAIQPEQQALTRAVQRREARAFQIEVERDRGGVAGRVHAEHEQHREAAQAVERDVAVPRGQVDLRLRAAGLRAEDFLAAGLRAGGLAGVAFACAVFAAVLVAVFAGALLALFAGGRAALRAGTVFTAAAREKPPRDGRPPCHN